MLCRHDGGLVGVVEALPLTLIGKLRSRAIGRRRHCAGIPATTPPDAARAPLIAQAFRLEWFTIAWMTIESVIAIGAGIAGHSISLTAFGIDSLIELASAACSSGGFPSN
jgi:hypothetical protein